MQEEGDGFVKSRSAGGDEYELTNLDGEHPVCLSVKVDGHPGGGSAGSRGGRSISTSVEEGPCRRGHRDSGEP